MKIIKLFADAKINDGRQIEFDWAKGLAVLFMVLVHAKIMLPGFPLSHWYSMLTEFPGSPLAAPVFMAALGAGIVYTKNASPKRLAVRGLTLLTANYAINFCAFGIPYLILFFRTNDPDHFASFLHDTFGVDILAFAGLTFLFFAAVAKLRLKPVHIALVALVCAGMNFLVSLPVENAALGAISGLFARVNEYSYFPFLAWIGYPVMGYLFATLLIRCADKKRFYQYTFAFSALVIGVVTLSARKYDFDLWGVLFGPEDYYYQDFIQYFLVGGIVFAWLSALYAVTRLKWLVPVSKTISRWSRNVTPIYFIHLLLIGWTSILGFIEIPADPAMNIGIAIAVLCLSDGLAVAAKSVGFFRHGGAQNKNLS